MVVFHIQCGGEAHGVAGKIVSEDDGSHGSFAGMGFAHEKNFFLCHL